MRKRLSGYRFASGFLALNLLLFFLSVSLPMRGRAESAPVQTGSSTGMDFSARKTAADYAAYDEAHAGKARPQVSLLLNAEAFAEPTLREEAGKTGVLLDGQGKTAAVALRIEQEGVYHLALEYYALPGKSKDVVCGLMLDGAYPFSEAESLSLSRTYRDAGGIEQDFRGNDLRPGQEEVFGWSTVRLAGSDGYYDDPYAFYFTVGEHTLTFTYYQEAMLIGSVVLEPVKALKDYQSYSAGADMADSHIQLYEAERPYQKSSSMLYPTYDRSSAATSPSHYSKIRYNTIGQSNWGQQGQWISWEIESPKDGWYTLSFKARQNYQQGLHSYRRLYIDGEVPFEEVKNIAFAYKLNWYMETLGGEEGPYLFFLKEGRHEIRLEVCAGPMGQVLKGLSDVLLTLNSIYRSMIMVTGATPDPYRVFYLMDEIPGLEQNIRDAKAMLDSLYAQIVEITGTGGSEASVVLEMSDMLQQFLDKPLKIPDRISRYKTNLESIGSLILTFSTQPLELDYIVVSANAELPRVSAGFWESLCYAVQGFIASFTEDYTMVGGRGDKDGISEGASITVWISSGRDQSQILKNRIDNVFTPRKGISVQLSIVSTAASTSASPLVQATLAGQGPDAALFTPKDTPVNLAMRGALAELSSMEGYQELYGNFYESAWIPYIYEDGVYALPETQNFDMLFYRTDIFEELDLEVPKTWEEFYTVVELLQKNNLGAGVLETNAANAGISAGISFFDKLLLQNGGTYYTEDLTKTAFDTPAAYNAFEVWTDLYTEYKLDRSFDFYNRFRTGEMPMGIMTYTMYNQLTSAAPELRGLWAMAPIPGTVQEDGRIRRSETASGTGAVMLNSCREKKAAWEFLKWWVSGETQTSYATELEASLGVAARCDTANIEAFSRLGWSDRESAVLREQWEEVTDILQIPGNYFISRCLTNAFRTVVDDGANPVRTLNMYNKDMNAEIARKRQEFHLDY